MPDTPVTSEINLEERARQQVNKTGAKVTLKKGNMRGKIALILAAYLILRGR